MNKHNNGNRIHYGWFVLITGMLVVFCALGLARFGYTTVLPSMQADMGINNEQAGLLATFNLTGYLALSMIGGILASKYGVRLTAALGLLVVGIGMILTGISSGFASLAVWRTFTGIGSGAANIAVMGLWSAWFSQKKRGLAAGVAVSGSSLALIFTGIFVPRLLGSGGSDAWRSAWLIYGAIALIIALISYLIIRNSASDMGMDLIGSNADVGTKKNERIKLEWKKVYLSAPVWALGLIYSAFGFSYIIYNTFFVKSLITDHNYTNAQAGNLFMIMGWFSLLCGLVWGAVSDRIGRKKTLIILYILNSTAFALFAFGTSSFHLYASAMIYGISAWSIPAIMAAACGDMLGRSLAPAALGFITLFFGIGQAAAPAVAGNMADLAGSFRPAFILASLVALFGAFASSVLIKKRRSKNEI